MTTSELWGKDRAGLMERLGMLAGKTTYCELGLGGVTPYSSKMMTMEAKLLLALKMGQTHQGDVGPWIVYSIALQIDDRKRQIVEWLAGKLERGCGIEGRRNSNRMLYIAQDAYHLAVYGAETDLPKVRPTEYQALVNIGAGWLWVKCEATIERAVMAGKLDNDGQTV